VINGENVHTATSLTPRTYYSWIKNRIDWKCSNRRKLVDHRRMLAQTTES